MKTIGKPIEHQLLATLRVVVLALICTDLVFKPGAERDLNARGYRSVVQRGCRNNSENVMLPT